MIGTLLQYAGVATFAASSAAVSRRSGADPTATIIVACVAAIGGGTIRDLLIHRAVFWIVDPRYVLSCIVPAMVVWFVGLGRQGRLIVMLLEAVGIGSFTVVGAATALEAGTGHVVAIIMGVLTATFGGLVSESLASRPTVLAGKEVYVTASLAAAIVYDLLIVSQMGQAFAAIVAAISGAALRVAALRLGWKMPSPKRR